MVRNTATPFSNSAAYWSAVRIQVKLISYLALSVSSISPEAIPGASFDANTSSAALVFNTVFILSGILVVSVP